MHKIDASSILPADKRWNAAWAVGVGWTPTRYGFLRDSRVITSLNLKASYGKMANLAGVSSASAIGTFSYSTDFYGDARLLELLAFYNTDLKPEQTESIDAGLSLELFKRVTFGVNFYRRDTDQADEKLETHIQIIRKVLQDFPDYRIVTVKGRGYYLKCMSAADSTPRPDSD